MSIRPSYRKRSVVQVLAHGMNAHPPTGRSCCDEAALTANELARRNEELSEAQDKIAALKRMTARMADERNRNVEAKFEALAERDEARGSRDYWIDLYGELRDELQSKLDDPYSEVNQKAAAWDRVEAHPLIGPLSSLPDGNSYAERVGKRLDQLADMEATINELQPAENPIVIGGKLPAWAKPTLDREAVKTILFRNFQNRPPNFDRAEKELSALAFETANAWPEWLGPKIDPDDYEVTRDEEWNYLVDGAVFARDGDTADEVRRRSFTSVPNLAKREKVVRLIESEQAATGDEAQHVEEQAKALAEAVFRYGGPWDNVAESARERCRAAIRAGWGKGDKA